MLETPHKNRASIPLPINSGQAEASLPPSSDLIAKLEQTLFASTDASGINQARDLLNQAGNLGQKKEIVGFIEGALALCRQLYEAGRSFAAIPIARTSYALSEKLADFDLKRRAATAYGVVLCDKGDYAGAIEYHAIALRLAQQIDDKDGIARAWNSIGLAFLYAASYGFAAEAFSLAVKQLRRSQGNAFPLFVSYTNLAQCYLHLLDPGAGLSAARKAIKMETSEFTRTDPLVGIFLRRNYVRLLILVKKVQEARPLVDEAIRLSHAYPSPRTEIAAMVTQAIYEVACGEADVGMTRLRHALELAREHPVALRDTLTCLAQAEEVAGHRDRAAFYLNELADTVYRDAIEQARKHIQIAEIFDDDHEVALELIDHSRKRLRAWAFPPPSDWITLVRMAATAGLKRDGRAWHNLRVGELTRLLALESGCEGGLAMETGFAAELHDIGMLTLPEKLLTKAGVFMADERSLIESHCRSGVEILSGNSHPRALIAMDIAHYHHEAWDGSGYPHGIAGEAIPKPARLCAVADCFDAMLSHRSYRDALALEQAVEKLQALAGTKLDPHLVEIFLASLRGGVIGKFVGAQMSQPPLSSYDVSAVIEQFSRGGA